MTRRILYPAAYLAVAAAAMSIQVVGARQNAVQIDADDIGGVVTSARDPRPASGSSPRPRTCQRGSAGASSRTIAGGT